jgi:hypothetical protein
VATGGTYSDPTTSVNDFCEGFLIIFKKTDNPLNLRAVFPKKCAVFELGNLRPTSDDVADARRCPC